jgi:hypothetical protein
MAIILKANKVNLFVSSDLFVFRYHSPNILDTPHKHVTYSMRGLDGPMAGLGELENRKMLLCREKLGSTSHRVAKLM